jgi:hypothetical protein
MALEFDLGETLDWCDRHDRAHPEPVPRCPTCAVIMLEPQVKADLAKELRRPATRREVDADPRMIAAAAQTTYDLIRFAHSYGVQPQR